MLGDKSDNWFNYNEDGGVLTVYRYLKANVMLLITTPSRMKQNHV